MDKKDLNELIKAAASALDLSQFKGDLVMYKHVEKEMNIAAGGIGEQHIHYDQSEHTAEVSPPEAEKADAPCDTADDAVIPPAVKEVIVQPALMKPYIRTMMDRYYGGSPLSLALIYCVLNDYSIICSVGDYLKFVKALQDWHMLPPMTDAQQKRLADGVSAYMRARRDHGKLRPGLSSDFRSWADTSKRKQCEAIASVFGPADDYSNPMGTIHYRYKKK